MKLISTLLALGLLAALPAVASAQDGHKKHGKKEALLMKFDKDGDGKLSKDERRAAREALKAHREEGDKQDLRKKILRRFDRDGNGTSDDGEREALKKFLDSHRERHDRKRRK